MSTKRITLKDIAKETGLSAQAVSLALRDSLRIAEETRARVKAKAEAMGYVVDPALRALSQYRTSKRSVSSRWNQIAILHDWEDESAFGISSFYRILLHYLHAECSKRGIELHECWLGWEQENANRIYRQLRNRGITGVFLAPPPPVLEPKPIVVPKSNFQVVTFGPEHLYANMHTIQFDYFENLRLAWSRLYARGRRRIGLVYAQVQGSRTGHAWEAAYHVEKLLSGVSPHAYPPLVFESSPDIGNRDAYVSWVRRNEIDAVITGVKEVDFWNRELESPPETAFFNVRSIEQQGIDVNIEQMAITAVEILLLEMQRSLVAHSNLPLRIHIPGKWVDPGELDLTVLAAIRRASS